MQRSRIMIIYQGKAITKLFPSGYYEIYSDVEGRFLKFDDLDDAKAQIDREVESYKEPKPSAGEVRGQKHPGKFEGGTLIDEWLYNVSLDGGADEEAGEADTTGWYGLMAGDLLASVESTAKEAGETLTADEREFLRDNPGAIIFENSQGFVDVTWYSTEAEARKEFSRIEAEIEAEDAENEESDE